MRGAQSGHRTEVVFDEVNCGNGLGKDLFVGGRCSLYMRYAETLQQKLGIEFEVHFCDDGAEVPPPAMLIGDILVAPSDGVIVSPEDIAQNLRDRLPGHAVTELGRVLEATHEPRIPS